MLWKEVNTMSNWYEVEFQEPDYDEYEHYEEFVGSKKRHNADAFRDYTLFYWQTHCW